MAGVAAWVFGLSSGVESFLNLLALSRVDGATILVGI
jgi:hypothetical protein